MSLVRCVPLSRKTHIPSDMCYPTQETQSVVISLAICVPLSGKHIPLAIWVSRVGEHISLGIVSG